MKLYILLLVLLLCTVVNAETTKLRIMLSALESTQKEVTTFNYSWALTGQWKFDNVLFDLNSDYSKNGDSVSLDRLQTTTRILGSKKDLCPLILIQTKGEHNLNSVDTLISVGYRKQFKSGFLEITTGIFKDLRTDDAWVGDTGINFGITKTFGRLHIQAGPKATWDALGTARIRDNRFRYTLDFNANYTLTKKLGIGYKYYYDNKSQTQWIGITYTIK